MFELTLTKTPESAPVRARTSYLDRLGAIRDGLLALDEPAARARFGLVAGDRLLKTTISLCPDCLAHVAAAVYARGGRVWMNKTCALHGATTAIVENDETYYALSNKDLWGRRYAQDRVVDFPAYDGGGCCGSGESCGPEDAGDGWNDGFFADQLPNKSCTVLVEVTNACNLACQVCYSDAKGGEKLPLAEFKQYLTRLIEAKGGLDSVQLTGGEAVLHPEFWEMVEFLHRDPRLKKIFLPTNGLLFARPENADRLVAFRDKLMVHLQFDGAGPEVNQPLRAADTTKTRERVLDLLSARGIHMQLTMTITRGVNEGEVGWVIAAGLRRDNVKAIALQPATYSGRYDLNPDPVDRATLSDIAKAVLEQSRLRMGDDDFMPIPCSHPNCGWITLFVRRFGFTTNVVKFVNMPRVIKKVAYKTLLSTEELRGAMGTERASLWKRVAGWLGGKLIRSTDVFAVAIKPFMDRFSYDQDRISNCCHHLLDTAGRPVSFCEYNALTRTQDPWQSRPAVGRPTPA